MALAELLATFAPDVSSSIPHLERLVDELLHWNRSRNLTAITNRDEVLEKHLVDSLTLLPFACQASRLLDIGSGAGFPALPLKIVCSRLEIVSVDAVSKKIDFQRHVVRVLGLQGFSALHGRIEQLTTHPACQSGFDLITARALCGLAELVGLSEPFLAPGGRVVAMKGPEAHQELAGCQELLLQEGWVVCLHQLRLPVSGAERCLVEVSR